MSKLYEPGDRVWVLAKGYKVWWPARVLSPEEAPPLSEGKDMAVVFYAGTTTGASLYELNAREDAASIALFEMSSPKAVTRDADLAAAIHNCDADASAKPLRVYAAASSTTAAASSEAAVSKRTGRRFASTAEAGVAPSSLGAKRERMEAPSEELRYLSSAELTDLAARLREATAAGDVAALRSLFRELDHVDVGLRDLGETKIGVAVGDVLGSERLRPLWALARATLAFWAHHLPRGATDTLRMLRTIDEDDGAVRQHTALEAAGSPLTALRSPVTGGVGALGGATPTTAMSTFEPRSPGGVPLIASPPTAQRRTFRNRVMALLMDPTAATAVSAERAAEVADRMERELPRDARQLLLMRVEELPWLRERFVSGQWAAREYLAQPAEAFSTDSQKREEEERLQRNLEAITAAEGAGLTIVTRKCQRCGNDKCSFVERQMRGGDEPTTKFFQCTVCQENWKEE